MAAVGDWGIEMSRTVRDGLLIGAMIVSALVIGAAYYLAMTI